MLEKRDLPYRLPDLLVHIQCDDLEVMSSILLLLL